MKLSTLQIFLIIGAVALISRFRGAIGGVLVDLVKGFEGVRLSAYQDSGGVWTIGYGLTRYPDGRPVQQGDTITQSQADSYFLQTLQQFAQQVEDNINVTLRPNQFAALVSLAYNIGINAFKNSTILDLVNENPNNPDIRAQFMRWVYVNGNVIQGLINRRTAEANLYFQ